MASPASLASNPSRTPALEDLVNHFVAAKRALNTQTALWRANDIVNDARRLLEENAVLAAKNAAVRAIVDEQTDALQAVLRGMHMVAAEVQAEFEQTLHDLDSAFSGLQSTLDVLRDTPIEAVLQPQGTPQKHLYDFIDNATVTNLSNALRDCIDRYNATRAGLSASNDAFETALVNLHSSVSNVPSPPGPVSLSSPIPSLYFELEGHAKEAAQAFQSLVSHYDLCVTALRHTEGGSDAATKATGDAPPPSEDGLPIHAEPIREEERQEMLAVLQNDAHQVEHVVTEIRERASEMDYLHSQIEDHINLRRQEDSALGIVLSMISQVASKVKSHIAASRSFRSSWLEDTRPTLLGGIGDWDSQREFYERFDLAYAELLVEVASRRRRHEKARQKAEEAQKELDRLHAEDERARKQFAMEQGDFLPLDIWPGLRQPPKKYEIRAIETDEYDEGEEPGAQSIPQLGRTVVERALIRVKRKM